MKVKRLPDAELEVMLAVWDCGDPTIAADILHKLTTRSSWQLPTLMTVLYRLVNKGYISCEKKGRNNLYHIIITSDEYRQNESKTLLQTLYGDSIQNFVTSMYDNRGFNNQEIEELREFLNNLEQR